MTRFKAPSNRVPLTFVPNPRQAKALLLCSLFLRPQQNGFGFLIGTLIASLEVLVGLWIIQLGARRHCLPNPAAGRVSHFVVRFERSASGVRGGTRTAPPFD